METSESQVQKLTFLTYIFKLIYLKNFILDKIVENDFKLFKSSEETILGLIGQKATFECHFIGAYVLAF